MDTQFLLNKNYSHRTSSSFVKHIAIGAVGLEFDSRVGHIGHSVAQALSHRDGLRHS